MGSAIISQFVVYIFVAAACTAGKGIGKIASFVGKIFMVQVLNHENHEHIFPHENYPLYGKCTRNCMLVTSQVVTALTLRECGGSATTVAVYRSTRGGKPIASVATDFDF